MEDSIDDFTKSLMSRARVREEMIENEIHKNETEIIGQKIEILPKELPKELPKKLSQIPENTEIKPKLNKENARILTENSASPLSRKSRLSALAQTINAWEDDLSCVNTKEECKEVKVQPVSTNKAHSFVGAGQQFHSPVRSNRSDVRERSPVKMVTVGRIEKPWQQVKVIGCVVKSPFKKDPSELSVLEKARLFEGGQTGGNKGGQTGGNTNNSGKTYFGGFQESEKELVQAERPSEDPPRPVNERPAAERKSPAEEPVPSTIPEPKPTPAAAMTPPQEKPTQKRLSSPAKIADSVKRIKVAEVKELYPSLTDIETSFSSSANSSMSTSSISYVSVPAAANNDDSEELTTTQACMQIDELIDEALEGQTIEDDTFFGSSPLSTSSPIQKKLTHTVSTYRKQQQLNTLKPTTAVEIPQKVIEEESNESDLKDEIQTIEQQILIQQKSIAQASKALNICETSFEFVNSVEYIEGERVLLIASQKRSQLQSELSKLKTQTKPTILSPSKSVYSPTKTLAELTLSNLQLHPTKQRNSDYVYHFIILLKHKSTVYHTNIRSGQELKFDGTFNFQLDPDFDIKIEVYSLRAFKRVDIEHSVKYHIKKPSTPSTSSNQKSFFSTPSKKIKSTDMSTPKNNSAIRTSNFQLHGQLSIDLSNLSKTEWNLSLISSANLILPNLTMNLNCDAKNEIKYQGFLTVFNDVSGLGAWHRKWASIENYEILFWTYPEDQAQGKAPTSKLSLSSCITPRITSAPRETCARPNTFLLVTTRDPLPTDRETLILSVHGNYTAIKHLISADDRTERDNWISQLNKTLTNMRAWNYKH